MIQTLYRKLLGSLRSQFDIREPFSVAGMKFNGFGEYRATAQRYVLSKRAALWEASTQEFAFVKLLPHLTLKELRATISHIIAHFIGDLELPANHMSTSVDLIFLTHSLSLEAETEIRKFNYRKSFKLGLQGWVDMKVAAFDETGSSVSKARHFPKAQSDVSKPSDQSRVITNRHGQDLQPLLMSLITPQGSQS